MKVVIIIGGGCEVQSKPHFDFRVGQPQPKKGKNNMLEISITNEQQVKVTLAPVTATGKPAQLDGAPSWSKASGSSTFKVSSDGLSATLVSSDTPGESMFNVEADADLGDGVQTISDAIKLIVNGAQATSLGMTVGLPEAKP
jgi:hypothetical protein